MRALSPHDRTLVTRHLAIGAATIERLGAGGRGEHSENTNKTQAHRGRQRGYAFVRRVRRVRRVRVAHLDGYLTILHIPHESSLAPHVHDATACHCLSFTFIPTASLPPSLPPSLPLLRALFFRGRMSRS